MRFHRWYPSQPIVNGSRTLAGTTRNKRPSGKYRPASIRAELSPATFAPVNVASQCSDLYTVLVGEQIQAGVTVGEGATLYSGYERETSQVRDPSRSNKTVPEQSAIDLLTATGVLSETTKASRWVHLLQ